MTRPVFSKCKQASINGVVGEKHCCHTPVVLQDTVFHDLTPHANVWKEFRVLWAWLAAIQDGLGDGGLLASVSRTLAVFLQYHIHDVMTSFGSDITRNLTYTCTLFHREDTRLQRDGDMRLLVWWGP